MIQQNKTRVLCYS